MLRAAQIILVGSAISSAAAQTSAARAGARPLLPPAQEIPLARSAAPASISAGARVLVLTDTGFVVADSGKNGVTCVVHRSWPGSIEPHCYDAEGARTVLPIEMHRTMQRHRGRPEAEIDREIADGIASGKYRHPTRPAMTYMMSSAQVLYDDDGKHVGRWRPHLMIYYPYLSGTALGLGATPDMRVGMVSGEGTPGSCLILIMPGFVDPTPTAAR
jgi:hypothetical protein